MITEKKQLELRMYFFTIYQLTGIQTGIQCGHAGMQYTWKYGRKDPKHIVWKFLQSHKTWIILNGGTTNIRRDFDGVSQGELNQILDSLAVNKIEYGFFQEPDLNDALTAVCFLADERVWNYVDYPNFVDYILDKKMYPDARVDMSAQKVVVLRMKTMEELIEMFPDWYPEWVAFLGGKKNVFLRELIRGKKLA